MSPPTRKGGGRGSRSRGLGGEGEREEGGRKSGKVLPGSKRAAVTAVAQQPTASCPKDGQVRKRAKEVCSTSKHEQVRKRAEGVCSTPKHEPARKRAKGDGPTPKRRQAALSPSPNRGLFIADAALGSTGETPAPAAPAAGNSESKLAPRDAQLTPADTVCAGDMGGRAAGGDPRGGEEREGGENADVAVDSRRLQAEFLETLQKRKKPESVSKEDESKTERSVPQHKGDAGNKRKRDGRRKSGVMLAALNSGRQISRLKKSDGKKAGYQANAHELKVRQRNRYAAAPDTANVRISAQHQGNPKKFSARSRADYWENPEQVRARKTAHYRSNPQKLREKRRKAYRERPNKWRVLSAKLYEKHKEKRLLQMRTVNVRNREIRRRQQNAHFQYGYLWPKLQYVRKGSKEHRDRKERFWRLKTITRMVKRHAKSYPSSAKTPAARRQLTLKVALQLDAAVALQEETRKKLRRSANSLWCKFFQKVEKEIGGTDVGRGYHVFTHEAYGVDTGAHEYIPIAEILAEIEEEKVGWPRPEQRQFASQPVSSDSRKRKAEFTASQPAGMLPVAKRPRLQNPIQRSVGADGKEVERKLTLARFCDATCHLPQGWARRLHKALSHLDPELELSELQMEICKFEHCASCVLGEYPLCEMEEQCDDHLKMLRKVQPHYCEIRSLTRRFYTVRQHNTLLIKLDHLIFKCDYEGLSKLLSDETSDDSDKNTECNDDATVGTCLSSEAEIYKRYGKQFDKFQKEITDFPTHECAICQCLFRKEKMFDLAETQQKKSATAARQSGKRLKLLAYLHVREERLAAGVPLQVTGDSEKELFTLVTEAEKAVQKDPDCTLSVCKSCVVHVAQDRRVPPSSPENGMGLDEIPEEVGLLNTYEMMLIQLAKSFHSVIRLTPYTYKGGAGELVQAVKGTTIHFPLPITETMQYTATKLPSPECLEILVDSLPSQTKRVWRYLVDLKKVRQALTWLKENNGLYKDIEIVDIEFEDSEPMPHIVPIPDNCAGGATADLEGKSLLTKVDVDAQNEQYTVQEVDAIKPKKADIDLFQVNRVTAEPLNHSDDQLDLKCYPVLFPKGRFGLHHSRGRKVRPAEFWKARLASSDPRFRRNIQYLFHALTCKDMRAADAGIYACMKSTYRAANLTVSQLKQKLEDKDDQLEANLQTMLSTVRGTKEYWNRQAGDLAAMDEKFGPASLFLTLSCAEYKWDDVRDALLRINADLKDVERARIGSLCVTDPVTVANQFERRFRSFLNNIVLDKKGPLGEVQHWYYRLEYQMRGAPHVHMKLWVKDCPTYGTEPDKDVLDWIQERITCRLPEKTASPQLHALVEKYQRHKCSASCRRRVKRKDKWLVLCRFGFPRAATEVAKLNSLTDAAKSRKTGKKIVKFYQLPRTSSETGINDYNPTVSLFWKANCDVQYCADKQMLLNRYITNYVTKSEKNATKDLFEAMSEEKSLRSRLKSVQMRALSQRQTGSYEAAAKLEGIHFHGSSDGVHWLNSAMKKDRRRRMKDYSELEKMCEHNPQSTETTHTNMIDNYYPNRPDELESETLYSIASLYEFQTAAPKTEKKNVFELKNGLGYLRKRTKEKVLKMPYYKAEGDSREKYFYQLLMLFQPWRDEESDLIAGYPTFQAAFEATVDQLPAANKFREARERIQRAKELADKLKEVEPEGDQAEDDAAKDCDSDNGQFVQQGPTREAVDLDELDAKIEKLNSGQRKIFDQVVSQLTHQKECEDSSCDHGPIRRFCSGVAGTGKSYVIEVLTSKVRSLFPDEDKLGTVVAVVAPTGLAAYNVSGQTVHRLLTLPVQHAAQSKYPDYYKLADAPLKETRARLKHLKLIIVDEISMVSSVVLGFIHKRLEELEGLSGVSYGNHNLIFFGDLLQLSPVNADFCFRPIQSRDLKSVFKNCGFRVNLWEEFHYSELTQNMRQADDLAYANLLNRVRIGSPTEMDIRQLQQLVIKLPGKKRLMAEAAEHFVNQMDCKGVCLLPLHDQVNEFNRTVLELKSAETVKIPAIDTGHTTAAKKGPKVKGKAQDLLASRTAGLETELQLSEGARVMLRRNLDTEVGLVNGACGEVKKIHRDQYNTVSKLTVKWDGIDQEKELQRVSAQYEISKKIYATRSQFPVTLAYSLTIHKCQGLSLDSALLYLGSEVFESAMCYVALSRVRRLDQLQIIELEPLQITAVTSAILEYNRLRASIGLDSFEKFNTLPPPWEAKKVQNRGVKPKRKLPVPKPTFLDNGALQMAGSSKGGKSASSNTAFCTHLKLKTTGFECYANCAVQALVALQQVCLEAAEFSGQHPSGSNPKEQVWSTVCKLLVDYKQGMDTGAEMDTTLLRREVDRMRTISGTNATVENWYSAQQMLDATEFFGHILSLCVPDDIRKLFEFQYQEKLRCKHCNLTTDGQPTEEIMLRTTLSAADEPNSSKQREKFDVWLGKQLNSTVEKRCDQCSLNGENRQHDKEMSISIPDDLKYFAMEIDPIRQIGVENGHMVTQRSEKQLQGFCANQCRLFQTPFQAAAVSLHFGPTALSGHYLTKVRLGKRWITLDDNKPVLKPENFVQNLRNVRLLILQRK